MPGRDVLFNLKVATDPAALKDLKTFADAVKKTQDELVGAGAKEAKKANKNKVDDATRAAQEISKIYQKAEKQDDAFRQSLYKKQTSERMKNETEMAEWRKRLVANSIQQEYRDNLKMIQDVKKEKVKAAKEAADEQKRLNRELERNLTNEARQATIAARNQARSGKRFEHARDRVIGGVGDIARGAAYTGLIGQDNTQTVLNTVAGVEGAASLYKGGRGLVGGIGTMLSGGTATGGAAVAAGATVAAAFAAVAASAAALTSAFLTAHQVIKHGIGRGADAGGIVDSVATAEVKGAVYAQRQASRFGRVGQLASGLSGMALRYATGGVIESEDAITRQKKENEYAASVKGRRDAAASSIAGKIGALTSTQSDTIEDARRRLRESAGLYNQAQGSGNETIQAAAVEAVRAKQADILRIIKEQQATAVSTAKAQFDLLHAAAEEAKRMADESKRALGGDLAKFALASPEEQARLREIKRKQDAGEELNAEEISTASQYSTFGDLAQSNAERRAMKAGAGDIFGSAIADRDRLAKESADAIKKSEAAKVDLEQKIQVEIDFKRDPNTGDKIFEELKPVMKAIQDDIERRERAIKDDVAKMIRDTFNRR